MNIKQSFFEAMYQLNPDPWQFASSPYELNRYRRICDVVRSKNPRYIFEPGCSIGILTYQLALLGEFVDAIDISPTAVSMARSECKILKNVSIQCASLTNYSICPDTDLIILSEIGYYFNRKEWAAIIENILATCTGSFNLLASHWLGISNDHMMNGMDVHSIIHSFDAFQLEHHESHHQFHLDYWIKQ